MSLAAGKQQLKDRAAFAASGLALLAGVLIWLLWVLPITRSVGEAAPSAIGEPIVSELSAGQRVGIWGSGRSAAFGTVECTVSDARGDLLALRGAPALTWDDTLWWASPRPGFEQLSQFTATAAGLYTIDCVDSLGYYEGQFLVAGDTFGAGSIGLGRTGSNDFAVGSALAFSAVVLPLFAVLVPLIVALRRWPDRQRAG